LAVLGCDARIAPLDGRHGPPARAAWLTRIVAPGRYPGTMERTVSGIAGHFYIEGPPGLYKLSAEISGTACLGPDGNEPLIEVRAEDSLLTKWTITPGPESTYDTRLLLDSKPRRVDLVYPNDFASRECDRNVKIRNVEVSLTDAEP
jgi:hypothetical protein